MTPETFVGSYGPRWRGGVLTEHEAAFIAAGGVVRDSSFGMGTRWADLGTYAVPMVCSELVMIDTEDGPVSGRCGENATVDGSCPVHAAQRAEWLTATEAETIAWERNTY